MHYNIVPAISPSSQSPSGICRRSISRRPQCDLISPRLLQHQEDRHAAMHLSQMAHPRTYYQDYHPIYSTGQIMSLSDQVIEDEEKDDCRWEIEEGEVRFLILRLI